MKRDIKEIKRLKRKQNNWRIKHVLTALKILHYVCSHNWKITKQEEMQGKRLRQRGRLGYPQTELAL